MSLIEMGNTYVNTAHVITARHRGVRDGDCYRHELTLEMIGGKCVSICSDYKDEFRGMAELREIELALTPTVAAAPGFYVLEPFTDSQGTDCVKHPVLAWRLGAYVEPVCLEEIDGRYAILQPDGQVIEQAVGVYDSAEAWLKKRAQMLAA